MASNEDQPDEMKAVEPLSEHRKTDAGFDGSPSRRFQIPLRRGELDVARAFRQFFPSHCLYIYGYLNRVQSSRRLEREALRNVELMWLTGR